MFWVSEGGLRSSCGTPHNLRTWARLRGDAGHHCAVGGGDLFEDSAGLLPGPIGPDTLDSLARANWLQFVGPQLKESDPL